MFLLTGSISKVSFFCLELHGCNVIRLPAGKQESETSGALPFPSRLIAGSTSGFSPPRSFCHDCQPSRLSPIIYTISNSSTNIRSSLMFFASLACAAASISFRASCTPSRIFLELFPSNALPHSALEMGAHVAASARSELTNLVNSVRFLCSVTSRPHRDGLQLLSAGFLSIPSCPSLAVTPHEEVELFSEVPVSPQVIPNWQRLVCSRRLPLLDACLPHHPRVDLKFV
mmetsp:Transcript_43343/g.137034  ORF Transcript_43343/g.137034 Transcript_43343/m.137034 type:complete len:229 (-) Transcript_43343:253-939(-)